MTIKLNSMRVLEQHKIPYEALEYPDTIKNAVEVAEAVGAPCNMVYKTLVIQAIDTPTQRKPFLILLASNCQLDLKKAAKAVGMKKVKMAKQQDAEALTGLKVGGISALALLQKQWQVYLDSPASGLKHIIISAGQRGVQLRIPINPLITLLNAKIADVGVDCDR